jgi:hypothetical protein
MVDLKPAPLALILFLGLVGYAFAAEITRGTGLIITPIERRPALFGSSSFTGELPASFDLSSSAHFPEPGDQLDQQSCVGFAVGYAMKTFLEARARKREPNRSEYIFSPAFIFNQINVGPNCREGGAQIDTALKLLKDKGVATLADFPYDPESCSTLPSPRHNTEAGKYRIHDFKHVENYNEPSAIKSIISSGTPVIIGMMIDRQFAYWKGDKVYNAYSGKGTGHAMLAVGYDDKRGAFKVLNSYGKGWGDKGYGWIAYNIFADPKVLVQAWFAVDAGATFGAGVKDAKQLDPVIALEDLRALHNAVQVGKPGVLFYVEMSARHAVQRDLSFVLRLWHKGRQWPVTAAQEEKVYIDARRQVAVKANPIAIDSSPHRARVYFFLPYDAINVPITPDGGSMTYDLEASVMGYLDGFPMARSPYTEISVSR